MLHKNVSIRKPLEYSREEIVNILYSILISLIFSSKRRLFFFFNMYFSALERYNIMASTDTLWRELDSCIEKLKYRILQSSSNKFNIPKIRTQRKFPDRNVKVLPENIGEMILKQGKVLSSKQLAQALKKTHEAIKMVSLLIMKLL